ncbi:DUF805 domain-containing protein [Cryobacterium sp. N22]|uniref:DUF805 domain-containing protein n=1 Tax=Cryobacterium sp. N22 TaxID=2048290 RepID=UPI000CE51AE1|nr:DUF805 domain-containing protein [Cryobacterium sp. N22]
MLTPQAAITSVFRNYATLSGRAPRSEFWWFTLFQFVLFTVVMVLGALGIGNSPEPDTMPPSVGIAVGVVLVLGLAFVIPSITLYVRRLHDADFSGWFYFLACIPYLGVIVMVVFALLPSQPAGARFDAVENTPSAMPAWNPSKTLS